MILAKSTIEALQRLDGAEPRSIVVAADSAEARIALAATDRFSVAFHTVEVSDLARATDDPRAWLSAHAADAVRALRFLEEPLAVWELDGGEQLAQLRSSPPLREGEAVLYWEVTLRLGERASATIGRYRWTPGMVEREPIEYPAAFALVGRIVGALHNALNEEA